MYTEAVAELLKQRNVNGGQPESVALLKQAYATAGIKGYWQKDLELANEQLKQGRASTLSWVTKIKPLPGSSELMRNAVI